MIFSTGSMGDVHATTYLFAQPSFLEGMARTLDIGGTFDVYNESERGQEADLRALENDWRMVGEDLKVAILSYGENE